MIRFNKDEKSTEKWMSCPKELVEYPSLAYIYNLTQLIVAKKLDKLHELFGKYDVGYTICNALGEKVFVAVQKNKGKQFQIKLFNFYGNEVISITSNWTCFNNKVLVSAPPDVFVGSVVRSCTSEKYEVKNSEDSVVFLIVKGTDKLFYSVLQEGAEVGIVSKDWEVPQNHDKLGVRFPRGVGVGMKAVLLGACFLIGLKY